MNNFDRKSPVVSIVVPSWFKPGQDGKYGKNETFWFAVECLKRLNSTTDREKCELIIIDNGSTLSDDDIREQFDKGEITAMPEWYWANADILVRNSTNLGFAPACNQGFKLARGEYIICLNNDILMWDGWVDALLGVFNAHDLNPAVGVVMPALMRETSDAREAIKIENIDLTKNADSYGVGAEFGSLWCAKREFLEEIARDNGGNVFDEKYKVGMGEDRQLWCEVRLHGRETYRTHKTRVFHQGNMSIGKIPNRKQYTEKNREMLEGWKKEKGVENKGIKLLT